MSLTMSSRSAKNLCGFNQAKLESTSNNTFFAKLLLSLCFSVSLSARILSRWRFACQKEKKQITFVNKVQNTWNYVSRTSVSMVSIVHCECVNRSTAPWWIQNQQMSLTWRALNIRQTCVNNKSLCGVFFDWKKWKILFANLFSSVNEYGLR